MSVSRLPLRGLLFVQEAGEVRSSAQGGASETTPVKTAARDSSGGQSPVSPPALKRRKRPWSPARGPRVACVSVPLFPLAARLRAEPELKREAVAILDGHGTVARVVAASRLARRAGVRVGMTLVQARARVPKLVARARDPECEGTAYEVMMEVADSVSPRVEGAAEEDAGAFRSIYLDISGLARRYRNTLDDPERELAHELIRRLDGCGLPARVGIAASKLAARVAAAQPDSPAIVPPGDEAEFLAPLPLQRLTPEAEVASTLSRWGLQTIGEFAALPKEEVTSRLGELGRKLHLVARGVDPRPLQARPPAISMREAMTLEWPIVQVDPLLFLARPALERLMQRLEQQGLGCKRLEISLQLEPEGFWERSLELPSPTREARTLLSLMRLDLEANTPGAPVVGFQLIAHPDAPKLAQLSLLGPAALSPDRLATTLARLFALLGPGRVGSPRPGAGHRPERFQLVEYVPPPPPKVRVRAEPGYGLLAVRVLRPAVAIEVLTDEPAGPRQPAAEPSFAEESLSSHSTVAEPETPFVAAESLSAATSAPSATALGKTGLARVGGLNQQSGLFRRAPQSRARPLEITGTQENKGQPRINGRVRVASGPWELDEKWWSEERTARDYWDVELDGGALYRIYWDRSSGLWYADGVYD